MNYLNLAREAVRRLDATEACTSLAEPAGDATAVWQAALDRLEGDPLFSSDIMKALREATVQWATAETLADQDNAPILD